MLVIIIVLAIGMIGGFILLLAATMLSSQISSMEGEYLTDEFPVQHPDADSQAGKAPQ